MGLLQRVLTIQTFAFSHTWYPQIQMSLETAVLLEAALSYELTMGRVRNAFALDGGFSYFELASVVAKKYGMGQSLNWTDRFVSNVQSSLSLSTQHVLYL